MIMRLRRFSNWLGLNKPNRYKIILVIILLLLNVAAFYYILSLTFFCNSLTAPSSCGIDGVVDNTISIIVDYTYAPLYYQNALADFIIYEKTYLDVGGYSVLSRYPDTVEYIIRGIFLLITLSIYLAIYYIFSCLIYKLFKKFITLKVKTFKY